MCVCVGGGHSFNEIWFSWNFMRKDTKSTSKTSIVPKSSVNTYAWFRIANNILIYNLFLCNARFFNKFELYFEKKTFKGSIANITSLPRPRVPIFIYISPISLIFLTFTNILLMFNQYVYLSFTSHTLYLIEYDP